MQFRRRCHAAVVTQPSQSIDSALLTGSRNGHRKCLELLIRGGADVNAAIEGTTPLIESAKCVHAMCMKTLLVKGADVNATDAGGGTALSYAVKDCECMELLIEAGANVNLPGSGGNIPLHNACSHGYINSIEMLLRAGADVNSIDAAEFTPLKCAAKYDHNNCIKRLIEAGAHVNATDKRFRFIRPYFFSDTYKVCECYDILPLNCLNDSYTILQNTSVLKH